MGTVDNVKIKGDAKKRETYENRLRKTFVQMTKTEVTFLCTL